MEVCLGPKSILQNAPKLIEIEGEPYILTKDHEGNPVLFSAICPHQHNIVKELNDECWRCPTHYWTFDPNSGKSINAPPSALKKFQIKIEKNFLYATIQKQRQKQIELNQGLKTLPKITLVGSAALLIEWNGFNILTDPWLERLAVFDSWINYPPSGIKVSDLPKIDAIWISHEHSDHYHEHTLSLLDKNIPVYVPDFDKNRLAKRVEKLGFKNIISMPHGQLFHLTDKIKAISFASGSIWNDNILYLQLGNFTLLDINDAGFNWNIKKVVGNVDLICIQFNPASAYPATWSHLDYEAKQELMKKRNQGMLRMIRQIVDVCHAKYVLPFANFNELCNPEHLKYVKIQPKNRPNDVVQFFKDEDVKVLDLFPGESWDGNTDKFYRNPDRDKFFNEEYLFAYLKNSYKLEKEQKVISSQFDMSQEEIKKYFESFNGSDLTKQIGKYTLSFTAKDDKRTLNGLIIFDNGKVTYEPVSQPQKAEMIMSCPGGMVQEIIRKDLYWDEITNGYWCTFSRNPDVYNVALWKLLHVPWQARPRYFKGVHKKRLEITPTTSIADIIEKGGDKVSQTFEKYGLYCVGCIASLGETVEDGCLFHGLSEQQAKALVSELEKLVSN